MKTLKIGILPYEDMKARTLAIARGQLKPGKDEPKVWLPSTETLGRVLSGPNRALLAEIARSKPRTMTELAEKTGRKLSNLSRTLKTMERYGLVTLEKHPDGSVAPLVAYDELSVTVPIIADRNAA
jgi:predicted transcriptional regulator